MLQPKFWWCCEKKRRKEEKIRQIGAYLAPYFPLHMTWLCFVKFFVHYAIYYASFSAGNQPQNCIGSIVYLSWNIHDSHSFNIKARTIIYCGVQPKVIKCMKCMNHKSVLLDNQLSAVTGIMVQSYGLKTWCPEPPPFGFISVGYYPFQ